MIARKRSTISRLPARWVSAPSATPPDARVERLGRAGDDRVGLDAGVGDDVDVVLVVGDPLGVGAVEAAELHPHLVTGVGEVEPDVVGERRELAPRRAAAVHDVEHLVDAVGGEVGRERRDRAGGELGVAPVDQGLVRLSAVDEGDGVVLRPGPRLVGRLGRTERVDQRDVLLVVERQQPGMVAGPLGLVVVVGSLRAVRHHPGPEVLHLPEVPQQVVRAPVGAGRHVGGGVAVGEHVAEPLGLVADVLEVRREVQSRHDPNLVASTDGPRPPRPGAVQRPD